MKYLSQIEDPKNKTKNEAILADRMEKFNAIPGYRVGDYIKLPFIHKKLGTLTRITHLWDDTAQTGGRLGSSYYLGAAGLGYSGGLDSGVKREDILPEPLPDPDEYYKGNVWFFNEGMSGAGRGITCSVTMRVFALREGADVSGVEECQCPYYLTAYAEPHRDGYLYGITNRGTQETAFRSVIELRSWLRSNELDLTTDLSPGRHQRLAYV